jgi:hypothetical protein
VDNSVIGCIPSGRIGGILSGMESLISEERWSDCIPNYSGLCKI